MSKDLLVLADEYAAATATFARALALKDEADSMSPIAREAGDKRAILAEALAALDTAQPALSGCACRWDADDNQLDGGDGAWSRASEGHVRLRRGMARLVAEA